jgi:hypothetical protein
MDYSIDCEMNRSQQKCKVCGRVDKFNYNVPDEMWRAIVPHSFQNNVVCLSCFDDFASETGIGYTCALQSLFFAGRKACFEFKVKQALQVDE